MKRGLLKSYLDANSIKSLPKDFISTKNRRPSRIEERIRLRRLRNNPHLMVKSPEQITEASENITAESRVIKNSCDSSSPRTESYTTSATSCSSSSNENMPKIRGSKQRVDLLELGASSRTPLINMRLKKSRGKSKNPGKLFMFHQGKLKAKTRPRSAPCTPLFQLKYAKQNWGRDNFVDYKIVEKDCIDQPQTLDDDTVDCEPVGNPALIAVMTESLDKMRAELNANKNSCAVDEEIDGDFVSRKSSILNANSVGNSLPNSVTDSEGVLLEKQESQSRLDIPRISSENENSEIVHEIHLDSNKYGCTVIEESTATSQSRYNNCNCTVSNPASGPGSSCTKDNLQSPKNSPGNKCCNNQWETSLLEKRPSSKPCGAQDTLQMRDDRGAEISVHKTVACTHKSEDCQLHRGHNHGIRRNFNYQSPLNENLKPWGNLKKDFCPCSVQRAGNQSNSFSLAIDSISEFCRTHCSADCCVRNCQLKIPQQQCANNNFAMSKQKSVKLPNSGMTRSCDCHAIKRSCRKICGSQRSKSSPRKVTFRLPSLIPEEEIIQNFEEDDKETNFGRICNHKFSNIEPNRKSQLSEPQIEKNETKKNRDTIFASCCNFNHPHCRSCCMGHQQRRSRSPKVHFCKEHLNKQQEIVGDFCNSGAGHREIESTNKLLTEKAQPVKNSDSKTSIGSEKDAWAEDKEDQNILDNFENVSFPKETRQAMNVLLQSRENRSANPSNGTNSGKQRRQRNQDIKVLNKPDLEIFDSEGQKAMHVATYAQALAVFQRKSDPLAGGSCKKKRNIVWKGSDGEIHSEYTEASELTLQKFVKRGENRNRRRNRYQSCFDFRRNLDQDFESRISNCPGQNTGFKMQTNGGGSENGSAENGVDRTGWTVGLINGRFKYLTAETFGFKINANGASLKKKQLWTLEGSEHQVFLRSHLDRYLAVDQFGNVTCEAEDTADPGCAFQIQVAADGSGRWALKNIQRGYFLGSSQDELKCTAKVPADAEYWLVHLAARPQVNLRSAGRKRFAHLSAAQDEIHVDAPVPWGEDTLFTLEFRPAAMPDAVDGNSDSRREVRSEAGIGGHYALHTCNNKYLARDGKLLDSCTRDCLYAAEFHAGMLALRDVSGAYLAPIGSKAVLKSRSNTVTRDELFSLEDSLPQASFVAALNQRYVSVKQGVDVTANQDEISGHETFQLEFDRATKRWYLRTMQDRYWTLEAGGGIQASDHKRSSNALFDLVWQPADGTVALRANNGKFLATKRSGHLYANADAAGDSEASKFHFYLMNRPVLVLRCEQGFVGLKSNASPKLECNKASYETIRVERCDRGIVRFKGQNGKYWHADSEGVTSDADVPADGFYLELREPSRICIKSTDGRYLSAGKNGVFRLGDTDYESATKWEF